MSDLKRLECKECGFKSDSLVRHISEVHTDLGDDALVEYIDKHNAKETDLVHPEHGKTRRPKIEKIELEKGDGGDLVPKSNDAYHFGDQAKNIVQDIRERKNIMLVGHTGCGKTSLVEQLASRVNQGILRVNLNGQTTIGDFVGLWTVKASEPKNNKDKILKLITDWDAPTTLQPLKLILIAITEFMGATSASETVWVDGALPRAMRDGLWLILDEIDFAEPAILSALNAVLEPDGKLMLKEKGHEIVTPHKNFRIFGTANTVGSMINYRHLYSGTNILNEAFLDRWRCYHVKYLSPKDEAKVLRDTVKKITPTIAEAVVLVANLIREAFEKEEIRCTFSLRRLIDWTELIVRHKDALKAAETAIFSKISPEDAEVIKRIIDHNINSNGGE